MLGVQQQELAHARDLPRLREETPNHGRGGRRTEPAFPPEPPAQKPKTPVQAAEGAACGAGLPQTLLAELHAELEARKAERVAEKPIGEGHDEGCKSKDSAGGGNGGVPGSDEGTLRGQRRAAGVDGGLDRLRSLNRWFRRGIPPWQQRWNSSCFRWNVPGHQERRKQTLWWKPSRTLECETQQEPQPSPDPAGGGSCGGAHPPESLRHRHGHGGRQDATGQCEEAHRLGGRLQERVPDLPMSAVLQRATQIAQWSKRLKTLPTEPGAGTAQTTRRSTMRSTRRREETEQKEETGGRASRQCLMDRGDRTCNAMPPVQRIVLFGNVQEGGSNHENLWPGRETGDDTDGEWGGCELAELTPLRRAPHHQHIHAQRLVPRCFKRLEWGRTWRQCLYPCSGMRWPSGADKRPSCETRQRAAAAGGWHWVLKGLIAFVPMAQRREGGTAEDDDGDIDEMTTKYLELQKCFRRRLPEAEMEELLQEYTHELANTVQRRRCPGYRPLPLHRRRKTR